MDLPVKKEHVVATARPLRHAMEEALMSSNVSPANKLNNLGLYLKTGSLSHILFVNELYELIRDQPGIIVEFGCWLGQNLVLFENLRAIHEPFNKLRKVVGFDTFEGHPDESKAEQDQHGLAYLTSGVYATEHDYAESLRALMQVHEQNNVLGHITHNEVIQGNVVHSLPEYLDRNDHTVIALAYFDMALYEPTKAAMKAIKPYLVRGSVLLLDEFNHSKYRGDTLAFREVFADTKYRIHLSRFMREKTICIIE